MNERVETDVVVDYTEEMNSNMNNMNNMKGISAGRTCRGNNANGSPRSPQNLNFLQGNGLLHEEIQRLLRENEQLRKVMHR